MRGDEFVTQALLANVLSLKTILMCILGRHIKPRSLERGSEKFYELACMSILDNSASDLWALSWISRCCLSMRAWRLFISATLAISSSFCVSRDDLASISYKNKHRVYRRCTFSRGASQRQANRITRQFNFPSLQKTRFPGNVNKGGKEIDGRKKK